MYICKVMEKGILIEKRLSKMEEKIDNLTNTVKEISSDIKEHVRWEAEKYEKLDTKYSAKWVETLTLTIAGGLVVAIIIAVLTFVIK